MGIHQQTEEQEQVLFLQVHRGRFLFCQVLLKALFHLLNMMGSCNGGYISFLFARQVRQEAMRLTLGRVL